MNSRCETLGDDLEMQQTQEAAAEAEAERGGGFRFKREAGVVEAQSAHGFAQVFEVGGVDGEETAEHDGLRRFEAGKRFGARVLFVGDRVADARISHFFDGAR